MKISVALVAIALFSIWVSLTSSALHGISFFFILTILLWAVAKTRRWI
jgi:hypothetical protein